MFDDQVLRDAGELKNVLRRGRDAIDTLPLEVGIPERRVDEHDPRGERADEFVKVAREVLQVSGIVRQPEHVARLTPTLLALPDLGVASHVVAIRVEAAARDDDLDAVVEDRGVNRVMSAEGMANHAEASVFHLREGFEQIEAAEVVPDRLHRAACIAESG